MAFFMATQLLNNYYTLVHLIKHCTKHGLISHGHQLHCHIIKSGFDSNLHIQSTLINFYLKHDSLNNAHKVFDEIHDPNVISWNTLISGYVKSGKFSDALCLFYQLDKSDVRADAFSFTSALSACGKLSFFKLGQIIHSKIVKLGVESNFVVENCLIDFYGKCGCADEAIHVFNAIFYRDDISWNSVIAACARNQKLEQAFSFLHQMPDPNTISYNEVINGIAHFGKIEDAVKILYEMPNPNSSSWNSIITGCVNRGLKRDALVYFSEMHLKNIEMDQFTFSCILSGIAGLSDLIWGSLVHCCTIKSGLDTHIVIGSALVDMYSKCGQIKIAESIFETLPNKNLVTWNAMISGFAHNGDSTKVISLFEELQTMKNMKPDEITFLNVLSACSHNQTPLQSAMHYLELMIYDYKIELTEEHCCSMIRAMGRRGEVWKGEMMIREMGFGSCGVVWRALLGACGTCGDLKVAEVASAKVIVLGGHDEFVYVILSNLYACYGKWGNVDEVRGAMRVRGARKEVGRSWI